MKGLWRSCGCLILATANGRQRALWRCRRRRRAAAAAGERRAVGTSTLFSPSRHRAPALLLSPPLSLPTPTNSSCRPCEADVAGDAERGGGATRCGQVLVAPPPRRKGWRRRGAGRTLPSRQRPQASSCSGPAGEGRGEKGRRRDAGGRHSPAPPLQPPQTPRVVTPPAAPKCAAQCGRGVSTRRYRKRRPWRLLYRLRAGPPAAARTRLYSAAATAAASGVDPPPPKSTLARQRSRSTAPGAGPAVATAVLPRRRLCSERTRWRRRPGGSSGPAAAAARNGGRRTCSPLRRRRLPLRRLAQHRLSRGELIRGAAVFGAALPARPG